MKTNACHGKAGNGDKCGRYFCMPFRPKQEKNLSYPESSSPTPSRSHAHFRRFPPQSAEKHFPLSAKRFFVRLRLNLHFTLFSPLYSYKYTFICIYTLFSATVIRLNTPLRKCFSAILAVFPLHEFHGKHYFCTVKENILKKTHTRIIPYDHARRNQRIRRGTLPLRSK